jgi:hypothetical protein
MATTSAEGILATETHENEAFEASKEMTSALEAALATYVETNRPDDPLLMLEASPDETAAEEEIATAIARVAGIEDAVRRLAEAREQRLRDFGMASTISGAELNWLWHQWEARRDRRPETGEFWWSRTTSWVPQGLRGTWNAGAGGLVFEGQIQNDGGIWHLAVRGVSWFGLDRDRQPSPGRYLSAPSGILAGDLFGSISGSTAAMFTGGLVGKESQSDCVLSATQLLRDPGGRTLAYAATPPMTLFSMHSKDTQWSGARLPGTLQFPAVEIDIDANTPLIVAEVEVKLDLTLKDGANFRFGSMGAYSPTFHKANQWRLVRV